MKLLIFLFLILPVSAFCQINFLNDLSWEQAASKAKEENKLIFLQLQNSGCGQCNEMASVAFSSSMLKDKFEQNFISLRLDTDSTNGRILAKRFAAPTRPVSLFIDSEGNILHRFQGSSSAPGHYIENADIALSERRGKQLSDYEKEYHAGNRDMQFLEEYLIKLRRAQLPSNGILEDYFGQLPVDSLKNFRIVKLIYSQGFSLDSRMYKLMQLVTPHSLVDSIYKSVSYQEAAGFNGAIINTSFKKAVDARDIGLAYAVRSFESNLYGAERHKGMMASRRRMINYYKSVGDTARYISDVKSFLSMNHMKLAVDSLKKMDEMERENQRKISGIPDKKRTVSFIKFAPPSQVYDTDLNNYAWEFFKMVDKKEDLETALKWSEQSMVLFDGLKKGMGHPMRAGNPNYLDTYAQLLYKLGRKREAIEWQTKAIEAQKATGRDATSFERTINRMKEGL